MSRDQSDLTVANIESVGGRDWKNPRLIDANGTKYVVGYNHDGWFDICHVDLFVSDEDGTVEARPIGDYAFTSFGPDGQDQLRDALEDR